MKDLIGKDVGRFHIEEQLGEGGMATVYKAFDTELERTVAIKFIRSEFIQQESAIPRFKREAQALAKLNHPNINRVLDYAWHEDSPYFILEYLSGGNLKQLIGEPMEWKKAAGLILQIGKALAYAHGHKVVHRDIKPGNILIAEDGSPVVSDFGIAKLLEQDTGSLLTMSGAIVGTPAYMSPEQAQGEPADHRSDLYSLAVVFYQLVTGHTPYEADTPIAVIVKQINNPLPSPSEYIPDLPETVERLFFKALAKDPANRYDSMEAFNQAIEKVLAGKEAPAEPAQPKPAPAEPAPPEPEPTPVKPPAAKKNWMPLVGIAAVALLAVAVVFGLNRNGTEPDTEAAVPPATSAPTDKPDTPALDQPSDSASADPSQPPFMDGEIVRHLTMDDFELNTGDWSADASVVEQHDGFVRLTPRSAEQDGVLRAVPAIDVGHAAVVRFQVLRETQFSIEYASRTGTWQTDSYEGVWINQYFDGRNPGIKYFIHWVLWDGVEEDINIVSPSIGLVEGVWYDLLIGVDAAGALSIMLWDESAAEMLWEVQMDMGYGWSNQEYQLIIHAISGAIDLAEYYELALDG